MSLALILAMIGSTWLFVLAQDLFVEVGPRVATPSSPEMSALLREVAEGADVEVVSRVVAQVGAEPRHGHMVAAMVIAERRSPDTIPVLREAWRRESAWDVRRWILRVFHSAGRRSFEALPEILEGVADPELRNQALNTLAWIDALAELDPAAAEERARQIARHDVAERYAQALALAEAR